MRYASFICAQALGLFALVVACASDTTEDTITLTTAADWRSVDFADDPFFISDSTDETIVCSEQSWQAEGETIEVNTTACNYVTLAQPLPVAIEKGQTVSLSAWWQTIASNQAASAHIEVRIGQWSLMNESISIPADADARELEVKAPTRLPKGTAIYFHVHNHGFNNWTLGELNLKP